MSKPMKKNTSCVLTGDLFFFPVLMLSTGSINNHLTKSKICHIRNPDCFMMPY